MPNDCWNHITFTAEKEVLDRFIKEELEDKDIPEWALKIKVRGQGGIIFNLWSRWIPDFEWLEGLLDKYEDAWIKNEWSEEGGEEGVWIGFSKDGEKEIKRLEWQGMCIEEEAHRFRLL